MSALETRFLELLSINRQKLLRICRVYAWTSPDREDLYQEILFQIWRGLPTLKEDLHANTWLYRVAINTGISHVRKTKSIRKAISSKQDQLLEQTDQLQTPNEHSTQLDALYEALAKLNKAEKGVMTLMLEGFSYEDIAEVMGMNANQVGVLVHRTRKKLMGLMEEVTV